eukprot:4619704-Ditylum_brightwellii.AAC.1
MVAKDLYNLTLPEVIKHVSSHSIRVGACVLLHSSGKDDDFIKLRLRWKSDTFRLYLRITTVTAGQHFQAVENLVDLDQGLSLKKSVFFVVWASQWITDLSVPDDLAQGLQSKSHGLVRGERQPS